MNAKWKNIRIVVLVLTVVAAAAVLLFPPSVYVATVPLTAAEKQAAERDLAMRARVPGAPPATNVKVPDTQRKPVLAHVPVWEQRPGKKIIWAGWTSPEDQVEVGTSMLSFLNGTLFQAGIVLLVGMLLASIAGRKIKSAADTEADGAAPATTTEGGTAEP